MSISHPLARPLGEHRDVVVVGGRVAGAATAMLLARQGRRVLVVERGRYGDDTLSTHALLRAGVLQLHRWGVLDRLVAAGTPPLHRTTFSYPDEAVVVEMKPADGIDALYAPRRTVLDPILVDAAVAAGAEVAFETTMVDLLHTPSGRVQGITVRQRDGLIVDIPADLVIGADGARSRVATGVGAEVERRGQHAGLAVYTYVEGLETNGNEWHYAPEAAAGVIPTNEGLACVFAGTAAGAVTAGPEGWGPAFRQLLHRVSPDLARRVGTAHRRGRFRAHGGRPGHLRRAHGPGWALVGDAGYFKDPITAHGLTDALRDAELLARAVEADDLAGYQTTRDAISHDLFSVTDTIASYRWTMDEIKVLLRQLSDATRAELEVVRALAPPRDPVPI
jgi:flavin-dependent dehydrogenase